MRDSNIHWQDFSQQRPKRVVSESLGLVNDFLMGLIKVTVLLAEANNNQLCLKGEGHPRRPRGR